MFLPASRSARARRPGKILVLFALLLPALLALLGLVTDGCLLMAAHRHAQNAADAAAMAAAHDLVRGKSLDTATATAQARRRRRLRWNADTRSATLAGTASVWKSGTASTGSSRSRR